MRRSNSGSERAGRAAAAFFLGGLALLAAFPAPALAQDMVHRLAFRAGSDEVLFVTIGGEITEIDGTFTQVVTVRAFVNGEIAGAIANVAVSAPAARRLAHGPAILFLDLCGLLNDVNAVAENFGLTLDNLPPGPSRLDLDRLDPAVRTQVGPYLLAGVAANARAAGAMVPPPVGDRRLRLLQIRQGTLTAVPGNPLERPIVLNVVSVETIPPADTNPPTPGGTFATIAVFAPAEAFLPPGPIRFTGELNPVGNEDKAGDVVRDVLVPSVGDLPPSPIRQFMRIDLGQLPPSPIRLVVSFRFADGTVGTGAVVIQPPPIGD